MSTQNLKLKKRRSRLRIKLRKITNRSRLSVFKSSRHIHAQIIDDENSKTLVAASTLDKQIRKDKKSNCNKDAAIAVGKLLAERATKKSIKQVVFDKGGHKYHGVIKALADEARKKLEF